MGLNRSLVFQIDPADVAIAGVDEVPVWVLAQKSNQCGRMQKEEGEGEGRGS